MPGVSASVSISIQVQSVAQRGRLGVAKFCLRRSLAERHWKSGNFRHSERIKWQIDIDSVGYLGVGTYEGIMIEFSAREDTEVSTLRS